MKSRLIVHLMSVLVLASALAGCHGLDSFAPQSKENEQASGSTTPADQTGPAQEQETRDGSKQEPEAAEAQPEESESTDPPVALLWIDNETTSAITGNAPLKVSFKLEVDDQEPGALEWSFSPGDGSGNITGGGDELPYTLHHTYERPGVFNVNFSIDVQGQRSTAIASVEVEEAAQVTIDPVMIEGQAHVGNPAHSVYCVRSAPSNPAGLEEEIDGEIHALDPAGPGWSYALEPGGNFTMYWYDDPDPLWITHTPDPEEERPRLEEAEPTGIVPDGATHVEICMDDPTDSTQEGFPYLLTLWAPGHPDAPAA